MPSLELSLFSTTKHARNGTGCAFLLLDSKIYLTFPQFSSTQPIPSNGDLRLDLEHLTENDWGIPTYVCNGEENDLEHLDNFGHCLYFLNKIFRGHAVTRAKRKEQLDALKRALGMLNSDTSDIDISDATKKNPDTDCDNNFFDEELPSRYLSEGSPDKLMMEALKELNIHDIRDFLQENVPPDKPFENDS